VVTAALARLLSRRGRRVLCIELGEIPSLGPLLGLSEPTYRPVPVADGILCARYTPAECMEEYGLMKLKLRGLYDLVFRNAFVKTLVEMMPGAEELLVIGKIGYMVQSAQRQGDRSPYDIVLVDAPPTGQGAGLFTLPQTVLAAVGSGPVAREMGLVKDLLTNPALTAGIVVTNPEELAVDEAIELIGTLGTQAGLPLEAVVMNKCLVTGAGTTAAREIARIWVTARRSGQDLSPPYAQVNSALQVFQVEDFQRQEILRLSSHSRLPMLELPWLAFDRPSDDDLDRLAAGLEPLIGRQPW
jgi:anion-transporting  ArsA/GET3 family ATPase